jgi:hypothetical protein
LKQTFDNNSYINLKMDFQIQYCQSQKCFYPRIKDYSHI